MAQVGQRPARANGRLFGRRVGTGIGPLRGGRRHHRAGAANTMAAFGEAAMSGSPLVLVASEVPTGVVDAGLGHTLHQSKDQAGMFAPLAKATFTPRSPQAVADDLAKAITTALTPPSGPVYLDIPADILRGPAASEVTLTPLPARSVDREKLKEAAELVNSACSVAIWVGGGAIESGAEEALSALAAHLQAPVITSFSSRGALGPTDPSNVLLPPHEPEVEELLAQADVLLAFGTDFDGTMTKNATLRLPPAIVDVNADPSRGRFGYSGVMPVLGDARLAMGTLLELTNRRDEGPLLGLPALRERVWARLSSDPRTSEAATFVASVERAVAGQGQDVVVVNDMTIAGYWLGELLLSRPEPDGPVPSWLGHARLRIAGLHWCRLCRRRTCPGRVRGRRLYVRRWRTGHHQARTATHNGPPG